MYNKKGFEMSFGWIFAILVGAVIIFLAIYAAGKLSGQEIDITNTESAKELGILLSPIETNLDSGKLSFIKFPRETKVGNMCYEYGNFGEQKINTSGDSGVGSSAGGVSSTFHNKYIFSKTVSTGRTFYVFAMPLELPYKIADLMFLWSDKESYCFVTPPRAVEDSINMSGIKNIYFANKFTNCPSGSKRVCFGAGNCDIVVSIGANGGGTVVKENKTVSFIGPLLYGAIFSSPSIYECQVKRLMKRNSELALLYANKADALGARGCNSNLQADLIAYADRTLKVNNSAQLNGIALLAESLGRRNDDLLCQMF